MAKSSKMAVAVADSVTVAPVTGTGIIERSDLPVVFYRVKVRGKASKTNIKELSDVAEQAAGAKRGTVTSLVVRVPECFAAPIKKRESQIRGLFYKEAIALGDAYGVPIAILPSFKAKLDVLRQEYALDFAALVEASENGVMERMLKEQLNILRQKVTPPTSAEIREGYGVDVQTFINFDSVAVQTAMKVLGDDIKSSLRADVEASVARENASQLSAAREKITEDVKAFLDDIRIRCSVADTKGIQYKTLVDKYMKIVNVLPAYNVTNDPEVSKLLADIRTKFDGLAKETLATNPTVRQSTIAKADEITAGFASMF